jgi:hypothetical protein
MIRISRTAALAAALAVALAGMLPAAHVHAADDHQVAHQHAIADGATAPQHSGDDREGGVDPPDHIAARILTLSFDLTVLVAAIGPPEMALLSSEPEVARAAPVVRTTLLPTHDPPLRFTSSPAPPAVV